MDGDPLVVCTRISVQVAVFGGLAPASASNTPVQVGHGIAPAHVSSMSCLPCLERIVEG